MKIRVYLKYLLNDCGFFADWASFQYGLGNYATYIPFYSSRMGIKMQQTPFLTATRLQLLVKKSKYTLWWNETTGTEILLITAKAGFCSLTFHILSSYTSPKVPKDFCDILTWQITRKLIVINCFFKDASVILLNMISSKGTFSKLSTTNSSYKFQNISKRIF